MSNALAVRATFVSVADAGEALNPEGFLYVCGKAELTADGSAIAGTLAGTIGYEAKEGVYSTAVECQSSKHRITLQRK